ncbi:hypothetical protein PYW07_015973 [Mythimna separata]|uniref:Protein phosphatase 1 regulatory subunit 36-like n=1 Tax=Mythimna separata TaxID=271217 RepID=A0AAD7YRL7_MYTSE|nr:hypothetical protein PYW07_015973 [Mythimna separata]
MEDEDDEGGFGGAFEDGHWIWDDETEALVFVSDHPPVIVESVHMATKAPTGTIEFRDDVDLIEQIRYRRRYQRKIMGQNDVITLQDVKDIALYTAPVNILSPMLINLLHMPTTERFLRAIILSCGYYIQISDEMTDRMLMLEKKLRTPDCERIENTFRENLSDLRGLVAKEYCTMLLGGADTKKFHHMGPLKKRRSLSDKDARLFETLLRMTIQIVWLALGRKRFNQIELEIQRIFKSEIFNNVEHTLKTGYIAQMLPMEQTVLLGPCVRHDKKLNTRSPLMNEVFCDRPMDYRLMGLGIVKYPEITTRLNFFRLVVACPEEQLMAANITLGIIGMLRNKFDTMLRPIPQATSDGKARSSVTNTTSRSSVKKSKVPLYPPFVIPAKCPPETDFPSTFPDETETPNPVSAIQHKRWLNRLKRLLGRQ